MSSAQPTRSKMSSTSRWKQIAREPAGTRPGAASSTTVGTCHRASSSAVVSPTGPAPAITTGSMGLALQLGPDLPVAFGGPDHRALDAGQFVPQPADVERQAVLEDRPPPVPR